MQTYDTNYGTVDAAVFGVLRKESARPFIEDSFKKPMGPLGIAVARGHVEARPLAKGARLVQEK